ncbi:tyrosine-type recombinase/integrase [Novipirellula artificiosorum]|uniref:Phage integrase family protein n=1 Tax=Novipirellula artificiosorum TaxID=2528016 RepID=A0A5C6DC66_9BACT|nr:tyrosine-type recombinase/integrase [Novipirellula artificiosorum]TWU33301.1 Phage integrase family protein [Novipirellula artificiosorum]
MVAKTQTKKPAKPRPDFPLYAHPRGYWCKSYGGTKHNCGPWDDPAAAERKWLEIKARLDEGKPAKAATIATVKVICNRYLREQKQRAAMRDISDAHVREVRAYCVQLLKHFGATRQVDTIVKEDFAAMKSKFPTKWSLRTRRNNILGIRAIFKWAWENDLIDSVPKYGKLFSVPPKRAIRIEKADKPKKLFTAAQVWSLIADARPQMRAMIWLGINAAYGNTDCAFLQANWIDWRESWLERPRRKTGEDRAAWLWPETVASLQAVLGGTRPEPKPGVNPDTVFLTRTGQLWLDRASTNRDSIGEQFRELAKAVGCYKKNVGYYSLRHTFASVASGCGDQIAVDHVMGHVNSSMSAHYREFVDRDRTRKACTYVRTWLLADKPQDWNSSEASR